MVVEYIRYLIPEDQAAAFRAAYARASESLRRSPECLGYELSVCSKEPTSFILRILWASTDDHLNGFRKGAEFPAFLAAIRPYIPNIQEMRHYAPSEVAWQRDASA